MQKDKSADCWVHKPLVQSLLTVQVAQSATVPRVGLAVCKQDSCTVGNATGRYRGITLICICMLCCRIHREKCFCNWSLAVISGTRLKGAIHIHALLHSPDRFSANTCTAKTAAVSSHFSGSIFLIYGPCKSAAVPAAFLVQ